MFVKVVEAISLSVLLIAKESPSFNCWPKIEGISGIGTLPRTIFSNEEFV